MIKRATDRIMEGLVKKARASLYPKDKVFVKVFNELDSDSKKKISVINENPPLSHLLKNEKMLTGQPFIALVVLLRCYRQILRTFDSWVNQQLIQNIVFYLLICLPL